VFDASRGAWSIDRGTLCATEDERFHRLAVGSYGDLLVSHVRQKTVGETSLVNTHPFERGRWVFAHNGTIKDVAWLRAQVSSERLAEVAGETDSELLFAWLLTTLDGAGVALEPASARTDRALGEVTRAARERPDLGAFSFLLSDGATTYAHRFGRSLFLLERSPEDEVRARRTSRDGTIVETPWSQQRSAVFVASERITDEPWQNVDDGMLLRVERTPTPHWRLVAA
jgi:predicted glutamine amidotransferase